MFSRAGLQADKETADPSKAAPLRNPARSYVAVAVSGFARTVSASKEFADRGITSDAASADPSPKVSTVKYSSDDFKTVVCRKKTTPGAPAVGCLLLKCGTLLPYQAKVQGSFLPQI